MSKSRFLAHAARCAAAPLAIVVAILALSPVSVAVAQVQRSFQNTGFEQPALTAPNAAAGCYVQVTDAQVPGWITNHPSQAGSGSCTAPTPVSGPLIELWRTNFNGVVAREGLNFAEINAEAVSRMSQNVCMVNGEQVSWRLSHRARTGTDVVSFNVDSAANQIVRVSTDTAGVGSVIAGSCGTGSVGSATCSAPVTVGTWADYTGSFTWNGASGVRSLGFEAISTGSGSNTVGNFLDNIQVTLTPYVQFSAASGSGSENGGGVLPRVVVVGNVTAPLTVLLQIDNGSSSATLGTDFTTPSGGNNYTMTIPVGNYDGTVSFDTGIVLLNDTAVENNETIVVRFRSNPATYTVANAQTCGAPAVSTSAFTVLDNDVDLRTTKAVVGSATPPAGGNAQFSVSYRNHTARPTVGDATAHDATVTILDPLPAGFTAFSWTCVASGTPAPVCPAAAGTGAINSTVVLPAGNAAAGGTLTFTVTGTLASSQCASVTNTASVAAASPFQEATSAQSGFTTPAPNGSADNSASAALDPLCAELSVTKTNTPASGPNDQAADTVVSGATTTYTLQVTNNGPDPVTAAVITDTPAAGIVCAAANTVTCSSTASPSACPAGALTVADLTAGVALGTLPATAGANTTTFVFSCAVQ
jgi:uncharacterized repeat protein (TIGR01451 family)